MPRQFIVLTLIACLSACAEQPSADSADAVDSFRNVARYDLVLSEFAPALGGEAREKTFRGQGVQGSFREDGGWSFQGPVRHTRLLCGTYQMGVQIGKGGDSCGLTDWSTPVAYGPERLQCNSASMIHSDSGTSSEIAEQLPNANCVRVVVRCSGNC